MPQQNETDDLTITKLFVHIPSFQRQAAEDWGTTMVTVSVCCSLPHPLAITCMSCSRHVISQTGLVSTLRVKPEHLACWPSFSATIESTPLPYSTNVPHTIHMMLNKPIQQLQRTSPGYHTPIHHTTILHHLHGTCSSPPDPDLVAVAPFYDQTLLMNSQREDHHSTAPACPSTHIEDVPPIACT